ncbi:hypothetical protein QO009_003058 [Brevibacillus aydinogluensis]|jgi:hypothetical protein|uniref:hypothetical protein n=1 Tax=Brevibacillus aydinogluensis TaxID=927786 RepID=UPI00289335D8|nr:hypothetical protein [Brevibacillus aydinogluensis]MDT3417163.1 hypothetical protein [Brevibacillus aydinogluensis]
MKKVVNWMKTNGKKMVGALKNNRGTVLLEKKVLLIAIVVGIFGFSSLAYPWIKSYFEKTSDSIENNSQINNSIQW